MSKTLLRHTLTRNIFDIFVDFLIFIHFHFMKIHRSLLSERERSWIFKVAIHTWNTIIPFSTQSKPKDKITYSIPVVDPDNDHAGIV